MSKLVSNLPWVRVTRTRDKKPSLFISVTKVTKAAGKSHTEIGIVGLDHHV